MIRRDTRSTGFKRRLAMFFGFTAVLAYVLGLVAFVGALEGTRAEPKSADAIVALTGGDARLVKAMKLLTDGRGKRLLISGVDSAVTRNELFAQIKGRRELFDCCVDLGRTATNTIGNAYEAAAWVEKNKYQSVILVTAAYHMPRSRMELEATMPNIHLITQPVFPEDLDTKDWLGDRQSAWVLVSEYTKYLFSWVRITLLEPIGVAFQPTEALRFDYGSASPGQEPPAPLEPMR